MKLLYGHIQYSFWDTDFSLNAEHCKTSQYKTNMNLMSADECILVTTKCLLTPYKGTITVIPVTNAKRVRCFCQATFSRPYLDFNLCPTKLESTLSALVSYLREQFLSLCILGVAKSHTFWAHPNTAPNLESSWILGVAQYHNFESSRILTQRAVPIFMNPRDCVVS